MTLFFSYGDAGDLGATTFRLGKLMGFASSAENGTIGSCGWPLDDASGVLSPVGLKSCYIFETACSTQRLWTGWATERTAARGDDSLRTGAARRWDAGLVDLNAALGWVPFHTSSSNRPAETDLARIAWYLTQTAAFGAVDNGRVASTGGVTLSANDYRGQYPLQLLADCAEASGRNYFLYYDETKSSPLSLYYQATTYTGWDSTLRLSNVRSDVDSSTTFAASGTMTRDPSEVYSEVTVIWSGGTSYFTRPSTVTAFSTRGAVVNKPNITTAAHAAAFGATYLTDHATEVDRLTATVKLPASKVNLILAGMRLSVKFSHLDGYSSFTNLYVANRNVAQDEEDESQFNVTLGLMNPRATLGVGGGTGGTGPPAPGQTPFQGGTTGLTFTSATCGEQTGGTHAISLGTCLTGELLVIVALSRNDNTTDLVESGWTKQVTGGAHFDWTVWTKTSDGTETQATTTPGGGFHYAVYHLGAGGSLVAAYHLATNGSPNDNYSIPMSSGDLYIAGWSDQIDTDLEAGWTGPATYTIDCNEHGALAPRYIITHSVGGTASPFAHDNHGDSIPVNVYLFGLSFTGALVTPVPGQLVSGETANGDGSTVTFTPTYGYVVGSLKVWVDGVPIINGLTATNGTTFTLDFAPKAARGDSPAEKVTWAYQST